MFSCRATSGLTARFRLRVLIQDRSCDLDVELRIQFGAVVKYVSLFDY